MGAVHAAICTICEAHVNCTDPFLASLHFGSMFFLSLQRPTLAQEQNVAAKGIRFDQGGRVL